MLSFITLNTESKSRHEMSVPNDVVGSVIGKRGSKINEIRQIRYLIARHDLGQKKLSFVAVELLSTSWKAARRGGREALSLALW